MLSSTIFHFVFAVFAIWAAVGWLLGRSRFENLRGSLLPLLALKSIDFPHHRSLIVRSIRAIEGELGALFHKKVSIFVDINSFSQFLPQGLRELVCFFNIKSHSNFPCFKVDLLYLSGKELFAWIVCGQNLASHPNLENIRIKKAKQVHFKMVQENEKYYWLVEFKNDL